MRKSGHEMDPSLRILFVVAAIGGLAALLLLSVIL